MGGKRNEWFSIPENPFKHWREVAAAIASEQVCGYTNSHSVEIFLAQIALGKKNWPEKLKEAVALVIKTRVVNPDDAQCLISLLPKGRTKSNRDKASAFIKNPAYQGLVQAVTEKPRLLTKAEFDEAVEWIRSTKDPLVRPREDWLECYQK